MTLYPFPHPVDPLASGYCPNDRPGYPCRDCDGLPPLDTAPTLFDAFFPLPADEPLCQWCGMACDNPLP